MKLIRGIDTVVGITRVSQKAVGEYGLNALALRIHPLVGLSPFKT